MIKCRNKKESRFEYDNIIHGQSELERLSSIRKARIFDAGQVFGISEVSRCYLNTTGQGKSRQSNTVHWMKTAFGRRPRSSTVYQTFVLVDSIWKIVCRWQKKRAAHFSCLISSKSPADSDRRGAFCLSQKLNNISTKVK